MKPFFLREGGGHWRHAVEPSSSLLTSEQRTPRRRSAHIAAQVRHKCGLKCGTSAAQVRHKCGPSAEKVRSKCGAQCGSRAERVRNAGGCAARRLLSSGKNTPPKTQKHLQKHKNTKKDGKKTQPLFRISAFRAWRKKIVALPIEQSTPGFANSRVRALPRALATGTAWAGLCLIHHHQCPRAPPRAPT